MLRSVSCLFLIFILAGCSKLQQSVTELDDNHITSRPEWYGDPELEIDSSLFIDFKHSMSSFWSGSEKILLSKTGDTLRVDVDDCGREWECFGKAFEVYCDLSKKPVLKVTARMEGRMIPELGISLKDINGHDTNFDRPSQRISRSEGYVDYYFDYSGKWKQSWPDNAIVDSTKLHEMLIFVNPGGRLGWTGTIYIDKVEAISLEEKPSEEELKRIRRYRRRMFD